MKKKITIKDVAASVGVSPTTVSHVLTGKRHVKRQTIEKVQEAVKALNYKPNVIAQSLKQNRTNTIGVIIPDITNPFFTGIVSAIESKANQEGVSVILNNYNDDASLEKKCIDVLLQKQVDGIILAPGVGNREYIRSSLTNEIPLVLMDRSIRGCSADLVELDNYAASFQAVEYLLNLGHRKIGFIGGITDISSNREREQGYIDALAAEGIHTPEGFIQRKAARISGGYEGAMALMNRRTPPTALFLGSNTISLGAIKALKELSVTCPDELSIISFGDFEWSTAFDPQLTCIYTPVGEMGLTAVEKLLVRIRQPDKSPEKQTIYCRMIKRDSCRSIGL